MSDEHNKTKEGKSELSPIAERETKTLEFWKKNDIFNKTLEKDAPKGEFVFYDGPPFATGSPHYGHLLAGTMKDVIPRFKTMQGFHVPRRWGWDTHGLPIENLIEKELGLKSKKDIEEMGIEKFNEAARAAVLRYDHEWKEIVPRTGRFVDMDNAYLTLQPTYSESIWWSFKTLYDKKLIYNGFKSMMLCPHCGTTLSNFEVAQGYKDITDISVYAKFELVDHPKTYFVAWTTTPWTLPGNVALAINSGFSYAYLKINKVLKNETKFNFVEGETYIIEAGDRMRDLFDFHLDAKTESQEKYDEVDNVRITSNSGNLDLELGYKIVDGGELINKKYKPIFNYYQNSELKNKENGWEVVAADFVTTTDGTGIVHIAPAFGEDDYNLSLKENLPFIQHVGPDGAFKKEVTDFAGQQVKPKEDPQKADVEIIKYLAAHDALFAKQKFPHSYPHCWRCDTPLLNYATSSWFVKVTDFKDKLVAENKKVHWVPEDIGEGRFGKWLENARDWAISRSRYWGAPLPVWECKECGMHEVMGSVNDIRLKTKRNTYFVVRHGEAEHNVKNILSSDPKNPHHLTDHGIEEVTLTAQGLKGKQIDLIVTSPFVRTKETTDIIVEHTAYKGKVVVDDRLKEYDFGDYNLQPFEKYHNYFNSVKEQLTKCMPHGECINDVKKRVGEFIYEVDSQHQGKNIVIVTHDGPATMLFAVAEGADDKRVIELWGLDRDFLSPGQGATLDFAQIPHNRKYEVDLHRPYIDEVSWKCMCGGEMKRVPEVFDTWYESGSMPYAQIHYPFENKDLIDTQKFFPADFIAEGQDQTRGWFYSLLVLSTALFGTSPYKNVIVNGIILAEDGQKMSKRLKNYPEIEYVLNKYGGDAMRYYLMNSPVVHAEDLAFSEKGVDEVVKKIILRLQNVYTFYETYKDQEIKDRAAHPVENILDLWIIARLAETNQLMTETLEKYELDRGAKPIMDFIDDLSTWYLRRSRDRFKGDDEKDKQDAIATLRTVLCELSKLMAPYMPFIAEDIYQKVKGSDGKESVHLEAWPEMKLTNKDVIADMAEVRRVVSLGLEARAKANLKVRQPLQSLSVGKEIAAAYVSVVLDELNVKTLRVDAALGQNVQLDTTITPTLKLEGQARDFIRSVQELRKKMKFNPSDIVELVVATNDAGKTVIDTYSTDISKTAQLKSITFGPTEGETITVDDLTFVVTLIK